MIVYDYICMTCRPMQQNKRNNQLTKKSTNWVSLAFLPMASNGTLNPTSSWIYPQLSLSDRGLSLLSTIINDDVLTFFGSWSTTIVDKRVVPTSSISFSAATDTPSLWKISSIRWQTTRTMGPKLRETMYLSQLTKRCSKILKDRWLERGGIQLERETAVHLSRHGQRFENTLPW